MQTNPAIEQSKIIRLSESPCNQCVFIVCVLHVHLKVQLQRKFFIPINELHLYKVTIYVIKFLSKNEVI